VRLGNRERNRKFDKTPHLQSYVNREEEPVYSWKRHSRALQSDERTMRNASCRMRVTCCRRIVETAVWVLVGLVVWRTWCLEGFPVLLRISGGSMAETLVGPHRRVICGDCGFPLVCGSDFPASDYRAVCPNCGYAGNDVRDWPPLPGDSVLVHRSMFDVRRPRRWEVVALRNPERPREVAVKRVAGLPGETVEIRDGHVYVNGVLVRKTLDEQRATGVLVHDARYAPHRAPAPPPRWRPDREGSHWTVDGAAFYHGESPGKDAIDWLTYHHARRVPGRPDEVDEGPVLNESGYNQGRPQRVETLRPVPELRLEFRLLHASGKGSLWVRATDGQEEFRLRIDVADWRYELFRSGHPMGVSGYLRPRAGATPRSPGSIEVSLICQQLIVAFDHRPEVVYPYESARAAGRTDARPFAIGVEEAANVTLADAKIFRDVVYSSQTGGANRLANPCKLTIIEYFVLGDNEAISSDSRMWPSGPGVAESALVGKPFLVFLPMRGANLAGWHFHIPDLFSIRYIR
jgi:signal peptidase I